MEGRHQGYLLLVEDEERLRGLVSQFLQGEGYAVEEAADGPEGVERYLQRGPFDLVLVDLNLPGFSGVEVCRRVKAIRQEQRLMVCSAAVLHDHEQELAGLGVDHFLSKPYHPLELLDHVAREVARSGTREASYP